MPDKTRLLVTGACGVTSRSVVRSLQLSEKFRDRIEFIGTDICYNRYGIHENLYSKIYYVPPYNDASYPAVMGDILRKEKIEVAIVIPEPEVLFWSEHPFAVRFLKIPPLFGAIAMSKRSLYECLKTTGLCPRYQIIDKKDYQSGKVKIELTYPFWVRDYAMGSTSGKGSFAPHNPEELEAWFTINRSIDHFMLSEFLPGRNLACYLFYHKGRLLKHAVAERFGYIMGKVSASGITGNTSEGRICNDPAVVDVSRKAVEHIVSQTREEMNGMVVIDLKEDGEGKPLITEINIRHNALTSSFASAGLNFSECHMLCLLGRENEISPEREIAFPADNRFLRDVDGLPIYVKHFAELKLGEAC